MLNKFRTIIAITLTVSLSSCASLSSPNAYTGESQINDTTKGVGLGATAGAGLGALVGGREGTFIGAGAGALVGGLIGHNMDNENAELRQRLLNTGVQITQSGNSTRLIMSSDVTFETDKSSFKKNFYPILDSVATVLSKYKNHSIVITGYTDNTGTKKHNQQLSEDRAQNVGNYLISKGISMTRVTTTGVGEKFPIASNTTAQGRAKNRRVEITLR